MLHLTLTRTSLSDAYTLGVLHEAGNREALCFTLEDPVRDPSGEKIPGETAIPFGRYPMELRTEGGMHGRYAERFRSIHEGMLWVRAVPNFEWVYLHVGNSVSDSRGCPLVGRQLRPGRVTESASAYRLIYPKIAAAIQLDGAELEVRQLP